MQEDNILHLFLGILVLFLKLYLKPRLQDET